MKSPVILTRKTQIFLSDKIINQIAYLHQNVEKGVEWSGVLIFTDSKDYDENNIPSKINIIDIVPMNIGNGSYTEHNMGKIPQFCEYIMENMDKEYYTGLIHSHHNMKSYFSGTDLDELNDNSEKYPYYLSLIVNYRGEMVAKIGVNTKVESKIYQYKSTNRFVNGVLKEVQIPGEKLVTKKNAVSLYNCDIIKPEVICNVEDTFKKKFNFTLKKFNEIKNLEPKFRNPWHNPEKVLGKNSLYISYINDERDDFLKGIDGEDMFDFEPEPTYYDLLVEDLEQIKEIVTDFEIDLRKLKESYGK